MIQFLDILHLVYFRTSLVLWWTNKEDQTPVSRYFKTWICCSLIWFPYSGSFNPRRSCYCEIGKNSTDTYGERNWWVILADHSQYPRKCSYVAAVKMNRIFGSKWVTGKKYLEHMEIRCEHTCYYRVFYQEGTLIAKNPTSYYHH